MDTTANADQVQYWNGPEGEHWVERESRFDAMLAPFVDPVLDAVAITDGTRVLDVGCGNGAFSRAAAARGGVVTGVDISAPMLARARERAAAEGLSVDFVHADAQVHAFAPEFDVVVSRFGVMFFADPEAAFANLAGALVPGGRVGFVCWQEIFANEWVAVPGAAMIPVVGVPTPPPPGTPGPCAFADVDRVAGILAAAGLADAAITELRLPILVGGGLDAAAATAFVARGRMGRMFLGDADEPTAERALEAVREALAAYVTPEGVRMGSATWLVTATR